MNFQLLQFLIYALQSILLHAIKNVFLLTFMLGIRALINLRELIDKETLIYMKRGQ